MDVRPGVSRGETEILKALWKLDKGSVGEIHSWISENEKEMDYSTVQTYVRRLEAKGYLTAQRIGRNKIYRAAVRRAQVVGEALDEFLDRLFDGQLLPMVRQLVDSRDVSPQEIQDLMSLVKQLQREQQDDVQ
ncbi:MAG: BlaI/MecI/CopY family transcriptional regulator [bacterium]|nr:BlaI/MecI/CopY family transcriptional regulator [bacterium]